MAIIPPVRRALPASGIRAIFDQAKRFEAAGERVWHLEIGRPDWPMPEAAVLGIREAVEADCVHYVANRGLAELRAVWSQEIASVTGRSFDPETELTVTVGASEGVCMAALALLGPGDEVVIPEPAWPHYHAVALMAGATPVSLPLRMEDRFEIDVDALQKVITPRTRMIVVNTPGNPTGAVQPASVLRDIARLATDRGIVILSDEVYQDFIYSGAHTSIGRYLEDAELFVYVNSLSKSLAMTGSRVGILGASARLSKALVNVHQYLTVCGVSYAQYAAHRALASPDRPAYLGAMRREFAARARPWLELASELPGWECHPPAGAFYVFPRVTFQGLDGAAFCEHMLTRHRVAMTPGAVFGADFGQHVRISFGGSLECQNRAANLIKEAFRARSSQQAA